jgi:hypothetical protein
MTAKDLCGDTLSTTTFEQDSDEPQFQLEMEVNLHDVGTRPGDRVVTWVGLSPALARELATELSDFAKRHGA